MKFLPKNADKREATKTRWKLITKNVYLLDFRYTLSAYDKYFYFGSRPNSKTLISKQDVIRKYALKLKYAFNYDKKHSYYKRSVTTPIILTEEERKIISEILGKDYAEMKIAEHNFYDRNNGFAIKYKTNNISYSEAYAGSGETAIVKLVSDLINADEYSLILLDEPETSLHPSAQKKLINFILTQIKKKKLQVVISTHSPDIIEGIPKEAISVFYENSETDKIKVIENIAHENAFIHIGRSFTTKKTIVVEDGLAKLILERVLQEIEKRELFNIKFFPGGASQTKQEEMVVYSKEEDNKHFIIFDGDQENIKIDVSSISDNEKTEEALKQKIKEIVGQEIKFSHDSGRTEQAIDLMLKYIKYHYEHVFYFPKNIPEEIIWDDEILNNSEFNNNEKTLINSEPNCKEKFALFTKAELGENSADDIKSIHKKFITKWIKVKNSDYLMIVEIIQNIEGS